MLEQDVKLIVLRSLRGPGSGFSDEPPEKELTYDIQEQFVNYLLPVHWKMSAYADPNPSPSLASET